MKAFRTTRTKRRRRGAALVEMAVCLPVLVSVVLGIIEFGRGMMVSDLIYNAARLGARQSIIPGSSNTSVTQSIENFLQSASVNSQFVTVTITVTPATGNPNPGNQVGSAKMGDLILVEVQVPFDQVSYITGNWLKGKTLSGTCAMCHE